MNNCQKCGAWPPPPKFHRHFGPTFPFGRCTTRGEHLHYFCPCGYHWTMPTADALAEKAGGR